MQTPMYMLQADVNPPSQREQNERRTYSALLGTHWYPPTQGVDTANDMPKHQNLKVNIKVASLNVNSHAAPAKNMSGIEKWSTIYQTMKENKLVILAIQETHLDATLIHLINKCFGKRLEIINSQHPPCKPTCISWSCLCNK